MLSSHLYLGLPLVLVVKGFHLNISLVALAAGILCIWPNQLSLWALLDAAGCISVLYRSVQFFTGFNPPCLIFFRRPKYSSSDFPFKRIAVSELYSLSAPMFLMHRSLLVLCDQQSVAMISRNTINLFVFIIQRNCVLCEVEAEIFCILFR